ncbi:MAG: hypothetical protein ACLRWH_03780 [Emergencia sp.]
MMDITKRNKNLIPRRIPKAVLAFMSKIEIFILCGMQVWETARFGIRGLHRRTDKRKVSDMINRGINESAGMLVVNPDARNTYKTGLENLNVRGDHRRVGAEIRTIILNKMQIGREDTVCVIGGESIALESAFLASEGTVIAVEYTHKDRDAMEDSISYFDLRNIQVIDHVDKESMNEFAAPSVAFLTASASMEQEIGCLMELNPKMNLVIYTLDFSVAGAMRQLLEQYGIKEAEVIQISLSKLNGKNAFEQQPAPWIITGRVEE